MKFSTLVFIYLIGWIGCFVVGMQFEAWRWRKRSARDLARAFDRGYGSGRRHKEILLRERDEFTSSVRILTGEEGYDDESFAGS
jgi:hypothetical protein